MEVIATLSVEAAEFNRLALSRRKLERADDEENGIRGIYDPREKIKYIITEAKLFAKDGPNGPA